MSKINGEGDIWYSYPPKGKVSSTVKHTGIVNYIRASEYNSNEDENKVLFNEYQNYLKDYPQIEYNQYGNIYLDRIIIGTKLNYDISKLKMNDELNSFAGKFGKTKQVNPLIYITDANTNFIKVLKKYWKGGKKNDTILILGIENNTIKWSHCLALTDNEDFFGQCAKDFNNLSITDYKTIIEKYKSIILEYYQRKSMDDFKIMMKNIDISLTIQIFIILINLILQGIIIYFFYNNDNKKSD